MDWIIILSIIFMESALCYSRREADPITKYSILPSMYNIAKSYSRGVNQNYLQKESAYRRIFNDAELLGQPRTPEELPASEPLHPGHSLLRPASDMLESAISFPHTHKKSNIHSSSNKKKHRYRRQTPLINGRKMLKLLLVNELRRQLRRYSSSPKVRTPEEPKKYQDGQGSCESRETGEKKEPIDEGKAPGDTLISPNGDNLQSSAKYPQKVYALVYGNVDNLGITYDKTPFRVANSGFRKDDYLELLEDAKDATGQSKQKDLRKLFHSQFSHHNALLGKPKRVEDLPEAELVQPGETLIKPAPGSLLSSIKFPQRDTGMEAVYGNVDNISPNVDKGGAQYSYGDARKGLKNEEAFTLIKALQKILIPALPRDNSNQNKKKKSDRLVVRLPQYENKENENGISDKLLVRLPQYKKKENRNGISDTLLVRLPQNKRKENKKGISNTLLRKIIASVKHLMPKNDSLIVIKVNVDNKPPHRHSLEHYLYHKNRNKQLKSFLVRDMAENDERENFGGEFIESQEGKDNLRKSGDDKKIRNCTCESKDKDDSADGGGDDKKNPGNPYTVHKGKYRGNWLWNFEMGDHMNVNPYAPRFDPNGPNGIDLFFGRKWWYFNQDDYLPFR